MPRPVPARGGRGRLPARHRRRSRWRAAAGVAHRRAPGLRRPPGRLAAPAPSRAARPAVGAGAGSAGRSAAPADADAWTPSERQAYLERAAARPRREPAVARVLALARLAYYGDLTRDGRAGLRPRRGRGPRPGAAGPRGTLVSAAAPRHRRARLPRRRRHVPPGRAADRPRRGDRRRAHVRVDACVIGSGAGGAVAAKELAEGGMSVAILEEGEWWDTDEFNARPREMMGRLYRDAGQSATLGTPADHPADRPGGGRHHAGELGHLLSHPRRRARALGRARRAERLGRRRTGRLLPPRRARAQRVAGAGRAGRAQRRRWCAGACEALGWSGDFVLPQRPRLRGLRRVRVRLPVGRQAARRHHLRPAGLGGGGDHLHRRARGARSSCSGGRARAVVAQHHRRGPADRALRPRGRGLRRAADAGAAGPLGRAGVRAGRQPGHPSRHRRARPVRRADRHVARRAPVLLRGRVRPRGHHAGGHRRAARPAGDVDPGVRRRRCGQAMLEYPRTARSSA